MDNEILINTDTEMEDIMDFIINKLNLKILENTGTNRMYLGDSLKLTINIEYLPEDK